MVLIILRECAACFSATNKSVVLMTWIILSLLQTKHVNLLWTCPLMMELLLRIVTASAHASK